MSKRSIPINDKDWGIKGQFAETRPVYDVLKKNSSFARQLELRNTFDNAKMESASKTMERKIVEKIDRLSEEVDITHNAYLRSLMFHWWDLDPAPYFYWDLK